MENSRKMYIFIQTKGKATVKLTVWKKQAKREAIVVVICPIYSV